MKHLRQLRKMVSFTYFRAQREPMRNILQELHLQGIPEGKALTTLFVIHQWLEENYPVLGVVSKSTLFKDVLSVSQEGVLGREREDNR